MNTNNVITIDGSKGEGGGQIFRTSLTLAMCSGQPVCITNIRAGRSKPGLLRQHLTCLQAAREICDAKVDGEALGSTRVMFTPGKVKAGRYHFSVGSAGSSTLIFQTILWPLLFVGDESELTLEGGTHNSMAPTFNFIEKSFLPVLSAMGLTVDVVLSDYGFYPAGGGRWTVKIKPVFSIKPLLLVERGPVIGKQAIALSSKLPTHIGERELSQVAKRLGWLASELVQQTVSSVGPGNVVSLEYNTQEAAAVFEAFGERRLAAEKVSDKAIGSFEQFEQSQACVCEHLADQLILPLVLGKGGVFTTVEPSAHLLTNIEVVKQFIKVDISLEKIHKTTWKVTVKKRSSVE